MRISATGMFGGVWVCPAIIVILLATLSRGMIQVSQPGENGHLLVIRNYQSSALSTSSVDFRLLRAQYSIFEQRQRDKRSPIVSH